MSEEKRLFRTTDRLELRNVRVMVVEEPKEINDETTLCSLKVISQPGDEKYVDAWVRVTGKNGLAQKIFNMQKGDRINTAGKPYFQVYQGKDGPALSIDIRFPEYIDLVHTDRDKELVEEDDRPAETSPVKEVVAEETMPAKRRGRPPGVKKMPFDE